MQLTRRGFLGRCAIAGASLRQAAAGGEIALEARPATGRIAGLGVEFWGYNGQMPGPVLEAVPGETLAIRFRNALPEATNLHFHGMHVSPSGNADNPFLEIPPGEELLYEVPVPEGHPAGTFWYHPHMHGTTARQVFRGLSGVLIVRGELDAIPEVAQAPEHILVLKDFSIGRDGRIPEATMAERMQGREGSLLTINGLLRPAVPIAQNGLVRLRIVNASSSRYYRLKIDEHPLALIALDGGALPAVRWADEWLLAPGQRIDVLVAGARPPGEYRIVSLPYNRGSMGMGAPALAENTLATLRYEGSAQAVPVPDQLLPVEPLPEANAQRTFVLSESMMASFLINGRSFSMDRTDTQVLLGSVEEWSIENRGTMDHPFHVHVNPFQQMLDGAPERAWRDIINVPRGATRRIRIAFPDFPGRTVYHCHILDHEDLGMMGTLEIVPG